MEFFEAVGTRRSVRRLTADPVSQANLMAILEAARQAPSSHHEQPWQFIVIQNPTLLTQLKDAVNASIDAQINATEDEKKKTVLSGQRFHATMVFDSPVVVVALTRPFPARTPEKQPIHNPGLQSVSAAVAHLHLAATALGYGGCWTTMPIEFSKSEVEAILEIKEPWFSTAFVSIGVPVKMPREIIRKPIEEIVTFR